MSHEQEQEPLAEIGASPEEEHLAEVSPFPPQERDTQHLNQHFFHRDPDGGVRVRMRFKPEQVDLIEAGAGDTPLMLYLHRIINRAAQRHADHNLKELQRRLREAGVA